MGEKIKNPEINPCIHDQLIYNKGAKNTQWGRIISSISAPGKAEQPHANLTSNTPTFKTPTGGRTPKTPSSESQWARWCLCDPQDLASKEAILDGSEHSPVLSPHQPPRVFL